MHQEDSSNTNYDAKLVSCIPQIEPVDSDINGHSASGPNSSSPVAYSETPTPSVYSTGSNGMVDAAACHGMYYPARPSNLPGPELTTPLTCYPSSCYPSGCFEPTGVGATMLSPSEAFMSPTMAAFYPTPGSQHPSSPYAAFAPISTMMYAPNGAFYPAAMYPSTGAGGPMHFTPMTSEAVMLPLEKMDLTVVSDGIVSMSQETSNSTTNAESVDDGIESNLTGGSDSHTTDGDQGTNVLQSNNSNLPSHQSNSVDSAISNSEDRHPINNTSANSPTEYFVMVHVNGGETFSVKVGGQLQNIQGPATVRMVSKKGPPMLMPMQVPPGHLVQQIVDENGVLTHVILSPYPPPPVCPTPGLHPAQAAPVILPMSPMPPYPHTLDGEHTFPSAAMGEILGGGRYGASMGVAGECMENFVNGVHTWIQDAVSQQQPPPHHQQATGQSQALNRGRPWSGKQQNLHNNDAPIGRGGGGRPQRKKGKMSKNHSGYSRRGDMHNNNSSSGEETGGMNVINTNNHAANSAIAEESEDTVTPSATSRKVFNSNNNSRPATNHIHNINNNNCNNSTAAGIRKILNTTPAPQVSDIEARSVCVQLYPPECPEDSCGSVNPADFTYELYLSENGPDAYYKCVFSGEAMDISIRDLKPNLEYYLKAATRYVNLLGNRTAAVRFKTEPSEPNAPKSPLLVQRTRCEIALKWANTPDNGSKLHGFQLEMKQSNDSAAEWQEVYNGPQHYYKVNKLNPATEYAFRLCATNSYGQSPWSEEVCYSTCGLAPTQPLPPQLVRQEVHGLGLSWNKRPIDERFLLEMEDEATCHGFIPVFLGDQLSYFFDNLRRNTRYRFRLVAENVEGRSPWSEVVTYTTLPDAPSPPRKLELKGKLQATKLQVTWGDIEDDGGSPVDLYRVQACFCVASSPLAQREAAAVGADDGVLWSHVFEGTETHCSIANATPGALVWIRVSAHSAGGWGKYSTIPLRVRLPPVAPSAVHSLRTHVVKSGSGNRVLLLMWNRPDKDGGAETLTYEVQEQFRGGHSSPSVSPKKEATPSSSEWSSVFEGRATECPLQHSIPGGQYCYRVRAKNEAGLAGPWSDPPLRMVSEASPPSAPAAPPTAQWSRSSESILVSWKAPEKCNGAPVSEYRVEMRSATPQTTVKYHMIYCGKEQQCEVVRQHFEPATPYVFRVQAVNSAGAGPFTVESALCTTGASAPGLVPHLSLSTKPTPEEAAAAITYLNSHKEDKEIAFLKSMLSDEMSGFPRMDMLWVNWAPAPAHGQPVLKYHLEWGPVEALQCVEQATVDAMRHFHILRNLTPQCTYKVRIQAQNSEGSGPFCGYQRATTICSPPEPPVLECMLSQTSALRLRWSSSAASVPQIPISPGDGDSGIRYHLDMSRTSDGGWQNVFTGLSTTYKVSKLTENTDYFFRIRAANKAGAGEWSPVYKFLTAKAPPPHPKNLRVSDITTSSGCVEWAAVKVTATDPIFYVLQLLSVTDNELEYKQVYRGSDTTCRLRDLQPATEYLLRVCAIKFCAATGSSREDVEATSGACETLTSGTAGNESDSEVSLSGGRGMRDIAGPFSLPISFTTAGAGNAGKMFTSSTSGIGTPATTAATFRSYDASVARKRRVPQQQQQQVAVTNVQTTPGSRSHASEGKSAAAAAGGRGLLCWWRSMWPQRELTDQEMAAGLLFVFVLLLVLVGFLAQTYLL